MQIAVSEQQLAIMDMRFEINLEKGEERGNEKSTSASKASHAGVTIGEYHVVHNHDERNHVHVDVRKLMILGRISLRINSWRSGRTLPVERNNRSKIEKKIYVV